MSNNMVISSNEQATRIHGLYNRNVGQMNAAMTRIATAQKINSAKDNASVWAISQKMRERMRANDQANQNAQNDSALLKTAQGGLDNTLSILNTLKERAVNAANDSNVSGDRTKIAEEVRQLVAQIDENANKVKFNGRVLLNGGGEVSSTSTNGTGTVSANAVTATGTYGNMATYGVTGFSNGTSDAVTSASTLVSLVGSNGETLFQAGDKITVNFTDNGVAKQASFTVTNDSKISEAFSSFSDSGLYGNWAGKGDDIQGGPTPDDVEDAAGNVIKAGAAGVYLTGNDQHNISGLSISVTTSEGNTRTSAQAALEPTAVQQSYGNTNLGSNTVYSMTVDAGGSVIAGDQTQFYQLGTASSSDSANATYDITINDTKITFKGSTTLEEISKMFKEKGVNVELHYAASAKDPLTYEGSTVTKGNYGSTAVYDDTEANTLNFVAAADQKISYIKVVGNKAANGTGDISASNSGFIKTKKFDTSLADSALTLKMTADNGSVDAAAASSGILPRGQALQFFVGGEQNFGVNFAIGKATSGNLLGSNADQFATKFLTKEGANSAIAIIDNAISKTLTEQTRLGAMEARLGYTSDNLITMNENLESGVAAYTGSDMAKEMTEYMKYSVVSQAAQYMLANAGQNAYNVLQLLQP